MISSSRATACGFSILAITSARPLAIALTSTTSSGRWTKDSAIQSMSSSSAALRSARSLSVIAEVGMVVSGRLTPFGWRPGRRPRRSSRRGPAPPPPRAAAPCRRRPECDGLARASSRSPDGAIERALASPGVESASSVNASPLCSSAAPSANIPSLSFGPCRSTSTPIGRPVSSSSERIIATRSRMASCEAWLMLMRKTSAPASNRDSDGLAVGGSGTESGDDLHAAAATELHEAPPRTRRYDSRMPHRLRRGTMPDVTGSTGWPDRSAAPSSSWRPCRCRPRKSRCGRSRARSSPAGPRS